jgi:hypothetical protein
MRPVNGAIIRRGTLAFAAGVLAFAASAGAAGAAGAVAKPRAASRTLSFKTRLTNLHEIPVVGQTSRKPRPGDHVVITDQYLAHGKVVGHDIVHCLLATKRTSLCSAAVSLPKGQLELQGIGPAGGAGDFTIAVIGGTRAYAHASGTATIRSGPHNTGTEMFRLRL